MSNLQMAIWSCACIQNVSQVMKFTKAKEWSEINDWMDERLAGRFQVRTHCAQFKESLQLWRRWGLYEEFSKWREVCKFPQK